MEAWLNKQLHIDQTPVHDMLNLRWNNREMVRDANLLKRVCHAPNCVDAAPEGMAVWRSIAIANTSIKVTIDDTGSGEVRIAWHHPFVRSELFGDDLCDLGRGNIQVRGSTFRDALGLYMCVIEMEESGCGAMRVIPLYLRVRAMSEGEVERILQPRETTVVPASVERADIPHIPTVNMTRSPVAAPIVPTQSIFAASRQSHGVVPTLFGTHPYAKVVTAPHLGTTIHTPESAGQPVSF